MDPYILTQWAAFAATTTSMWLLAAGHELSGWITCLVACVLWAAVAIIGSAPALLLQQVVIGGAAVRALVRLFRAWLFYGKAEAWLRQP